MATYFAVHNDCIFKNPSLFCCKKECLCNPSLCDCTRAVFSTSFSIQCGSQHDAQALLMLSVLDVENSVAVGFLMVLLLSKECTASFLQRAF